MIGVVTADYLWNSSTELRNGVPAMVVVSVGGVRGRSGSCTDSNFWNAKDRNTGVKRYD